MRSARLSSRHLVGRVGELAELELACREAAAGRPSLVLLSGESGVGKTRLLTELEQRISALEPLPLMLRGEAVEHGDTELPYAAVLAAVRGLVREHHEVFDRLSAGTRAQLAALLPALGDGTGATAPADGSGQVRLFEALLELFATLAERRPLVLCLEDVHWAEHSTRTFITYLARSLRTERVVLLLSYRSDELHRRHPLRPVLAELERLERARRIELAPFEHAELAEALGDILGAPAEESLVARLMMRSQGNPLYLEELLAAGLDGRGATPQSLRDAFLLRIERLGADAQRLVRVIAVGRELGEEQLAALTGLGGAELSTALREALAEQIVEAGSGGFALRHELLREALYEDLLPGERTDLHLALAHELERAANAANAAEASGDDGAGAGAAAALARHYEAAGDQPAALLATVRAALQAIDVHAYGEAADLAERALELWPRVVGRAGALEAAAGQQIDHVELLALAARAHQIGGDRARADVLLRAALRELDSERDVVRYATLLGRLARAEWSLNRGPEALHSAQRALALLPDGENGRERTELLAWLARTQVLRGHFRDALADGERALAAAVSARDRITEGHVLNTLGTAQMALGDVDEGAARLRRAIELARADDDPDSVATAYSNLADLLLLRGRTAEALARAREGLAVLPRWFGRCREWVALTLSEMALEAGDFALAREHLPPRSAMLVGTLEILRGLRVADLALAEGDEELAARALQEIEPLVARSIEPQWIGLFGALLGELRRRRGELADARAAVAAALDRMELCTDDVMRISRASVVGARIEADAAQRGRDLRDAAMVKDAVARARIHAGRLRAASANGGPVEHAARVTGDAELARACARHDPERWIAAAEAWEGIARPYAAAIARFRVTEAFAERGKRPEAAAAAATALERARELSSAWLVAEIEALCRRARLSPAEGPGLASHDTAGAGAPEDPFGLTARERQVLALVAEGATNRQIGESLFMAEKTASVHVSRILAKLGVPSRTRAAAVAHRLHLT